MGLGEPPIAGWAVLGLDLLLPFALVLKLVAQSAVAATVAATMLLFVVARLTPRALAVAQIVGAH